MAVFIRSMGSCIPERRMTNDDLQSIVETTDEWIRSHTGIGARHIADDGVLSSDLAAEAARHALAKAGLGPHDIDVIVLATASPDYLGFPSTACIVQDKIGAHGCAALDIVAGCTGFIYGVDVAAGMLETRKGRNALVIGVETLSRLVDWNDRASCVLFGDGAGAAVLSYTEGKGAAILKTILGADGGGARDLYLDQSMQTKAFERTPPTTPKIVMNGGKVYTFAVKSITVLIERLLHETTFKLDDFKWLVPHQANARIVQAAARRFGIPESRFYMNIEEYANTSAASVPIALNEMLDKGLIVPGDLVMTLGFGAGLTYGGSIIRF
ncbi:MAG: ketoacyl-ACP synthase III [Spirochaetes bacterium]|nr:ketoacyl-ACP synthase III [Spirochaetota bacterium]